MTRTTASAQSQSDRQSASLAALALTLLLIVIALYVIDALRAQAEMQECVLSGMVGCQIPVAP